MSKISESHRQARLGRVFPERELDPQEIQRQEAEMQELLQKCQVVFQRVQPELINDYYDWFMAIEPKSGDYFIDKDDKVVSQKAHEKHPNAQCIIFCINETGACDKI
ncbi:hypothetical protein [Planktothricoides raciborskii]|uniref:Uncharacterized protein n=1 Tax=Planktothricoides raciborskii FACHB-1370 TaxID=2949576 RepID=A0ABR8EKN7_9CYAN|nr:hypothetical protein [Planktothricoides raciborskii]MBD2546211.1 hypothetical protein [Planktothricoides raciborskii FACHB-1370]MBD2584484.1 hypothetical protein [Planktothricoides raciborskii FACHB-1261]